MINAFVTGETVTPVFTEKDLLIVGTGSGKTESLLHMAEKAKDIGGTVATVTISPDSPIAEICHNTIKESVQKASPSVVSSVYCLSFDLLGSRAAAVSGQIFQLSANLERS